MQEGLYDFRSSTYAQLMTNRNVPTMTSSGLGDANIAEGQLKMVPVRRDGRLWSNTTRSQSSGADRRTYLGSGLGDLSALYDPGTSNSIQLGTDGWPETRPNSDMLFWESKTGADPHENLRGWDIRDVRSHYYWVKDNDNRTLNQARDRARDLGGDLASMNPTGLSGSYNFWFGYHLLKKVTKNREKWGWGPWYRYARRCSWFRCTNYYRRHWKLLSDKSDFVSSWSGWLKKKGSGSTKITGFVDGSKIAASNGTLSTPDFTPAWNSGEPGGTNEYGTVWSRYRNYPRISDQPSSFQHDGFVLETFNYGGLGSAHAILEKDIPDNKALAVGGGKLRSYNDDVKLGAILELPFERTPELDGFTPIGEGRHAWFYVSNQKHPFEGARLAAQQVGGELVSLSEEGAEGALKRWAGNGWIGLTQDTAATSYDEPFNGWEWLSGGSVTGIAWADGEPNNGETESADATPIAEHYGYVSSLREATGEVHDGHEYLSMVALISVPKSKAPRIQVAYEAEAISENGAAYLEQAYQLDAEGQLMIGSEAPSGTSDVSTGIEYIKATVATPEANDQLELWVEFDLDGDTIPTPESSIWVQLLSPGTLLGAGDTTLEFGLGKTFDINLTEAFDGINARSIWRLWAFDTQVGHRWTLKQFDIFFNAPKTIDIAAAPDVLIGEDGSGQSHSGVTLQSIGLAVKNVNTGVVVSELHPSSQFNLYKPGSSDALTFALADLPATIASLNGTPLNGTWEATLLEARDPSSGAVMADMAIHQFTMDFLIPPGMATGPQEYITEEGEQQFVSNRIRLGGGVDLPTGNHPEDDIYTATVTLSSDYEEGVVEEGIHTIQEENNVVALLPQNPFLEVGIEAEIEVSLDGYGDVTFAYQTRDENNLYYVSTGTMAYTIAQRAAAMAGGHLMVPSSPEESEFVRLQGVHGWTGLIDADTNAVWVPITGEYLDPDWDLLTEFSTPPVHSDDNVTTDDQHSVMGAGGLEGRGMDAVAPATLEIGKAGSPGLTWAAITEDQLFYDIYDPASDRHYVGARIGDAEVLEGQDNIGTQGRIWRASEEGRILSFGNADATVPETPVAPTIDGFTIVAQTDSSDYFVSDDINLTYLNAQAACEDKGGRLATFETSSENDLIQNAAEGHIGLWKTGAGAWGWNNGATLTYDPLWSPEDTENPASDVAVVLTNAGWDRKSAISVSRAICEFEALEDFSAGNTAYMVPTSTNTFPISYESNTSFTLPTIVLLDSSGMTAMDGPAHFGESDWMLASQTRRRTPAWEVPVLLAPDPIELEELMDATHGVYTAQSSADGVLGNVQQTYATYNLGEVVLSNLWTTESTAENGTPLTLVDAAVHPDSIGGLENLLSDYDAGEFYLTPPPANHGMWREGSDVKTFNANTLKTTIALSPTGDFNDHEIHVAFPISAPKFNPETLADLSYSGADAVNNGLPYWGIPNGIPAYAEMYIRVRNELTGALFDTVLTTSQEPLLLKNCPHIMNDSIYMDIRVGQMNNSDGQLKFTGGDPVVISAAVLWVTEGRRTVLWSDRDLEHNTLTMCTDIAPNFVMQADPQEEQFLTDIDRVFTDANGTVIEYLAEDSVGVSQVTLTWNHSASSYSSGGSMYLQRRNYEEYGGTNLGWEYATGDPSKPWSFEQADAQPFYNVDADFNGNLDPIFYTDSTLFHNVWSCETAEYRVEQDMCGNTFHTPTIHVNIQGSVSDPWKYVDDITDGVVVSEGRYWNKIQIDWSSALDSEGLIDQFRVFRRLYTPADVNNDGWEQIFASEDINTWIDWDVAAGTLYEYRVGAVITCGTGNTAQQYYNPTPYPIGFRSNYGGVQGRVTFENGAPEDSVYVVVEPQGLNLSRNSLILEGGEYAKLDIDRYEQREGGALNQWPDIHSDAFHPTLSFVDSTGVRISEGVSVSQWVKVPQTTLLGAPGTGVGAANEAPLFSLNYIDPFANIEKESLSIWARKIDGDSTKYRLSARQSGVYTDFGAIDLDYNKYQHITFTMANVETGRDVPGMRIYVRAHGDDPAIVEQPVDFYDFRGPDDVIELIRDNWSAWVWNAATGTSGYCSDPNAVNFAGNELGGTLRHCDYEMPSGCTDPQGQNYLEYALFEPGGGEDACNYSYYGTGEDISVHWFSDDDANPYEYPVILRLEADGSETLVKNFWSALNRYQDSLQVLGMQYPFSSVVTSVKLPNGDYRLRVLDSRHEGDGDLPHMEATSFSGNFALYNSVGVNYVTCSQYIGSEASAGSYDFSIITHSALASGVGQIDNFLLVDCAECFSVNFRNNATIELPLTEKGMDAVSGASTYEFWWRTADVIDGEAYNFGDIFTIEGDDSSGDITLSVVEDTEDPSNMGNAKWQLTGPAGTMRRIPEQPTFNEYAVIPGQWYHVTLAVGQPTGDGQPRAFFTMRSTDQNLSDNEPWNNPRHFEFDNLNDDGSPLDIAAQFVIAPIDAFADFSAEKLILGGSDVLIHRLSIWEGILSDAESAALFAGQTLRNSTFNATNMPNETGVWIAPDEGALPFSRLRSVLVPDNAGRFVDQMLDKQLQPEGTNFEANPITEAYFVGSEVMSGSGALTVDGTTGADALPSINRKSIRRAPYGQCNPGCSRLFDACNFNPYANQFVDCELSCTGTGLTTQQMASERISYDEIRAWGNALFYSYAEGSRITPGSPLYGQDYRSWEAAKFWMQKYPSNYTDGLLLMYDADEGLGNAIYDRAKYSTDVESWLGHNAVLFHQEFGFSGTDTSWYQVPDPTRNYFANGPLRDLPQSLGNWDYSNGNDGGAYAINNIKYVGSGDFFDIKPSKSTSGFEHIFEPAQRTTIIGDVLLFSEDQDFTDKSAFDVHVDVVYLNIESDQLDYSGTGDPTPSNCPVKGVQFEVDGSIINGVDNEPIETDAFGKAMLTMSRGYHNIKPILTHIDEGSTEDDHAFNVPPSGKQVFISGPVLRETDGSAKTEFTFVDKTTRTAIGRVLAGNSMASKPWNESQNNLGLTSFTLTPIEPVEGANTYTQNATCQAVKITTDTLGQYEVKLLPKHYRISIPSDTSTSVSALAPEMFDHLGGFQNFGVEGWQLAMPAHDANNGGHPWVAAFNAFIRADQGGTYNPQQADYQIWDMTAKTPWSQSTQYPEFSDVSDTEALPFDNLNSTSDDVYARVDMVYDPRVELNVSQKTAAINSDSEGSSTKDCDYTAEQMRLPALSNTFLGEIDLFASDAEGDYRSPLDAFLATYAGSFNDEIVDVNDSVFPFPAGLPIVYESEMYCLDLSAGQHQKVELLNELGEVYYSFEDTIKVFGSAYKFSITNTLNSGSNQSTLNLDSASTGYSFIARQPTEDNSEGVSIPKGNLNINLLKDGVVVDHWYPFKHLIPLTQDTKDIPGVLYDMNNPETSLFHHGRFDAIILGEYVATNPVPVSSDPTLDFILRDPPGDQSFCRMEQGSTMGFTKSVSNGDQDALNRSKDISATASMKVGGSLLIAPLGVGISTGSEVDASIGGSVAQEESYSRNKTNAVKIEESMTVTTEISTSDLAQEHLYLDEDGTILSTHQDLFFGSVRNTAISVHRRIGPIRTAELYTDGIDGQIAQDLGAEDYSVKGTQGIIQSWEEGGTKPNLIPMFKTDNQGEMTLSLAPHLLAWRTETKTSDLPASQFLKTEFTIKTQDIALLEASRDAYFEAHPEFYQWPDGTPSNQNWPHTAFPKGMRLANNDDHRWSIFHQGWLDEVHTATANSSEQVPAGPSTINRAYQVPNPDIAGAGLSLDDFADYYDSPSDPAAVLISDVLSGDDRKGPGYIFLGHATQLDLDSVRYFNNQIASWSRMLAENEFEKINARRYIFDNLDQFDDPSELSNWMEDLESSNSTVSNFNLDDFGYSAERLGCH